MGLLNEIWSLKDGVSQCWWLSEACRIDWEAWAAVGTVAAVFAAVFAPSIQRNLVRRRANALFMAAYMHDLVDAHACLKKTDEAMPIGKETDLSMWVDANSLIRREHRVDYADSIKFGLSRLAGRDVDLTKWPAVDMHVATGVVIAIETTKAVLAAVTALPDIEETKLAGTFKIIRGGIDAAIAALGLAEAEANRRVGWLMADYRKRAARR
jgi:hypothetical protein